MGMWGYGLYQNDTALDVKGEFKDSYNDGKSAREITEKLIEDYEDIMGDADEEPLFWFALADTQWSLGVLMPEVKAKALYWIAKVGDMIACEALATSVKSKIRKTLDKLQAKILSPQPAVKRPVKKRIYKCQWNIGDVFAYRLESDLAKERDLYGRYFLIRKVDEGELYPGHIVPIVYVKITTDENLPSNVEEYDRLEYVQMWATRYEERFWPIDMSRLKEDIAEKSKMNYEVDEYGFLPVYRVKLLNTSKRVIPSKLIYVGNFANAACPQIEFVPHGNVNIHNVYWKHFDETFETKMIKSYCNHNLRELSIYTDKKSGL